MANTMVIQPPHDVDSFFNETDYQFPDCVDTGLEMGCYDPPITTPLRFHTGGQSYSEHPRVSEC